MQNRFVCNPGFEHRFLPEMFSTILGVIELQIEFMIACWKALDVYFLVLKSQIFLLSGFRDLGLEVEAAHWESESEQQIWRFSFKDFLKSNEVILFSKISGYVSFCSGILFGILDDYFMGFECVKFGCMKTGRKTGDPVFSPSVLADSPSSNLILILKFL